MALTRNVAVVLRGTIGAQCIGLVALPLMARLFPVAAFGQFQLYQSIVGVCMVIAAMRYEIAILSVRSARTLRAVLHLSLGINVLTAIAAGLIVAILKNLAWPSSTASWAFGGVMIALATLFGGVSQTLGYVMTRNQNFAAGSNIRIAQALGFGITGTVLGFLRPLNTGVIVADLANKGVSAALLTGYLRRAGVTFWPPERRRRLLHVARRYRDYPLLSLPGGLCNALTGAITPFMIFSTFGPEMTGQFGLVERSITLPITLIVLAVTQVFTAELAKSIRVGDRDVHRKFRQLVGRLALLGLLPAIALMLLSPMAFVMVFGEQWSMAGTLGQVLAPSYFLSFISGAAGMALLVMEKQRQQFLWEISRLVAIALTWIVIRQWHLGPILAVATNSGVIAAFSLANLFVIDHHLRHHQATLGTALEVRT